MFIKKYRYPYNLLEFNNKLKEKIELSYLLTFYLDANEFNKKFYGFYSRILWIGVTSNVNKAMNIKYYGVVCNGNNGIRLIGFYSPKLLTFMFYLLFLPILYLLRSIHIFDQFDNPLFLIVYALIFVVHVPAMRKDYLLLNELLCQL